MLSGQMRAIAATQGGVVSAAQTNQLGADSSVIRKLLGCGAWRRARRGVYSDPHFQPDRLPAAEHHARCAALLAGLSTCEAVVSHTSAVRLLNLPLPPHAQEHVVITRRPPAPANRLGASSEVHVARYDEADVIDVQGVPVLAGARLVLDCCSVMSADSALAVADAALRRSLTTSAELRAELMRWRGRSTARLAACVVERADPLAASWFESMSRWWLLEAGLPRPRLQVPFTDGRGIAVARVDMLIGRVVGEADGAGKYDEPGSLFAEKQREDWLRDVHQVEVVRWVPREMRNPPARELVVKRFHRALARRPV